jgi:hypothetical protein
MQPGLHGKVNPQAADKKSQQKLQKEQLSHGCFFGMVNRKRSNT